MHMDRSELAWAAGFFDGEGSTIARSFKTRPGYRQLAISLPQSGDTTSPPKVLLRFQRAMGGMGTISGPNSDGIYAWRVLGREQVHVTLQLLWPFLSDVKREQAARAITLVDAQYDHGAYRRRSSRSHAPAITADESGCGAPALEAAWAAGFLDAEGWFGLIHVAPRVNGPDWYRLRCSASQHGAAGSPPQVLLRLRALLGGRIERHGDPDDHKWLVEGRARVESVLKTLGPLLTDDKRGQAARALLAFDSQTRLKGDATRCLRGHAYSRSAMKGGRVRKICDQCEAIYDAREHNKRLIALQRFEEAPLAYTV